MKTKQEVVSFLESKLGTKIPCKGNDSLSGQCVTLIKSLMEFLGLPDPYKARGNASTAISAYVKEGIADPGTGWLSVYSNKNMAGGVGHIWCQADEFYESNGQKALTVTKGKTYSYDNSCNFDKYLKETMNCLIANDDAGKKLFEELVTKATKYDELVKSGVSQASDVTDMKRQIKEANDSASTATQEATDARNQIKVVAEKLNSPQDMPRILSAIEDMIKTTDQLTVNAKKDGDKIKEYELATVELKAEIKRLQLLLKGNKSLETATLVELLQEFVKRVTHIIKK